MGPSSRLRASFMLCGLIAVGCQSPRVAPSPVARAAGAVRLEARIIGASATDEPLLVEESEARSIEGSISRQLIAGGRVTPEIGARAVGHVIALATGPDQTTWVVVARAPDGADLMSLAHGAASWRTRLTVGDSSHRDWLLMAAVGGLAFCHDGRCSWTDGGTPRPLGVLPGCTAAAGIVASGGVFVGCHVALERSPTVVRFDLEGGTSSTWVDPVDIDASSVTSEGATVVASARMLAWVGGVDDSSRMTDDLEIFDIREQRWISGRLARDRGLPAVVAVPDGSLLVIGGGGGTDVERIDLTGMTHPTLLEINTVRVGAFAIATPRGDVWIGGGARDFSAGGTLPGLEWFSAEQIATHGSAPR